MAFEYGVIEGLYDQEQGWSWEARHAYGVFCQQHGFGFYIYAPKNDPWLREQWAEPWPEDQWLALQRVCNNFKQHQVRFGIGFTPYHVRDLTPQVKQQLKSKIALTNQLKPEILSILFDDFSNDIPNLAQLQAEIAAFIAAESNAEQFIVAGTYYSRDALLERIFGAMPQNYISDLGRCLDPAFDIFWTGDHVIALGFDQASLDDVAQQLRRKPFLWDNYPVNDPSWLKHRLRLMPFNGRPWQLSQWSAGHAVNPMIQPWLSMLPLATLQDLYQHKAQFASYASFKKHAYALCGEALAQTIEANLVSLTEEGRLLFTEFTKQRLHKAFAPFDTPFSKEIIHWLSYESERSIAAANTPCPT